MVATSPPAEVPGGPPSPLAPQPTIDLTDDSDDVDTAIYPTVGELLGELDEAMPSLGFTHYEEGLSDAGFSRVNQITDTPDVQQSFDQLAVPVGIRQDIFERAARMVRRAEKSKQVAKTEEDPSI
jgi:hypothetical protein